MDSMCKPKTELTVHRDVKYRLMANRYVKTSLTIIIRLRSLISIKMVSNKAAKQKETKIMDKIKMWDRYK